MVALHARRSAASVAQWRSRRPSAPLVVVLTGTDLYRDVATDDSARATLLVADRLVVLNDLGVDALPASVRLKARVILQSCVGRRALPKTRRHLRALIVGHLRPEKSPQTVFDAARLLSGCDDIFLDHIGKALDPALGAAATTLMIECPRYRWLDGQPHAVARRRIQSAHVLVHPSRLEGGANVIVEAISSGTPVLASRIDGNVGLLGDGYDGYFPWGNAVALASLLRRIRDEPAMLACLQRQCDERAPRFDPAGESLALHELMTELLEPAQRFP